MARKNPFANLMDDSSAEVERPALDYAVKGASRSIINSIGELAERADRLAEGETIIDLDPDLVDASFVRDRLEDDEAEFQELLEAIRERGQDSPILVRPHPATIGRYMVVFGRRRLKAANMLGRKVRAVVKNLSDRDHVIAQGQENSARSNLTFIERAMYADALCRLKYDDDNAFVLAALAIDKATLSKMLSVASLPPKILAALGRAKGIGRDRWYELKQLLEKPSRLDAALKVVADSTFQSLPSDERFNALVARLKASSSAKPRHTPARRSWSPEDGALAAEITEEGRKFTLALKARSGEAAAFGAFLSANLDRFYEAFRQENSSTRSGE
jgi:ParB family chromosome partitioning protein